ncbi:uncharacterized protein LOC123667459 [Melitaea cinxia]|uniref:uncharacterized protein LOC123667459 n=1 Tax=Melitaea cinxia TaxID=113334 RepID=UPI001E2734E6|nr:uncharacterized protein LOC123667459 [Melitaea cinxia]
MVYTRKVFKERLKWCLDNKEQIQMDMIASHHCNKDFGKFWKQTSKLNPRNTPVYAYFLDLSKAFDLVSYNKLWHKLKTETTPPEGLIRLLKYWYGNQNNIISWAGSLSEPYRLECGVRQGGVTLPKLFSLYVNRLIEELSSIKVGCSIDGTFVNNISYADDMVLLSPSIKALRKLLGICERYAVAHGLRYNPEKSEMLVFKAGNKCYPTVPSVTISGTSLKIVTKFKYLGHWVNADQSDDMDMERERRALAVRSNMLIRRFAKCTNEVKITLFRAYCQSFYTCSLWTRRRPTASCVSSIIMRLGRCWGSRDTAVPRGCSQRSIQMAFMQLCVSVWHLCGGGYARAQTASCVQLRTGLTDP